MESKKIKSALISVFYKDGLEDIVRALDAQGVTIYSTGGTQKFIQDLGIEPVAVESLTGYPSILGGRVKTLHPKVFGGILSRRDMFSDGEQLAQYEIPEIDPPPEGLRWHPQPPRHVQRRRAAGAVRHPRD